MINYKRQKTKVNDQGEGSLISVANDSLADICKYLEASDIKNLQATCRFFRASQVLDKKFYEKKYWQLFPKCSSIILLSPQGHAFTKRSNSFFGIGSVNVFQENYTSTPIYLPSKLPIAKIVSGAEHTFFFDIDGNCFYEGKNLFYEHGSKQPFLINAPEELILPSGNKISDITIGYTSMWGDSVFILDTQKNCYVRIRNNQFDLDLQKTDNTLQLLTLPNKKKVMQVAAGNKHLIFLDEDLQCHGMGSTHVGQLGLKKCLHTKPTPIPLEKKIYKILADDNQSFLLTENGEAYVAGENYNGELGIGWSSEVDQFTKVQLPDNSSIVEIKASEHHTFFKNDQGHWFSCGKNKSGELGHLKKDAYFHSTIHTPTLVELPNKKRIKTVMPAKDYSFFIDETGSVFKFQDHQISICLNEHLDKLLDKKIVNDEGKVAFVRAKLTN